MRLATNVLLVCLLLFGVATFVFLQNAVVKGGSPSAGYVFLALTLFSGAMLYSMTLFMNERIKKLTQRLELLSTSLDESLQAVEADEEVEQKKSSQELARKIADKIAADGLSVEDFSEEILSRLSKEVPFAHGLFYMRQQGGEAFLPTARFAFYSDRELDGFSVGEGINGQVVKDGKSVTIDTIPDNYVHIVSGLGKTNPRAITLTPIMQEGRSVALLELAFLSQPTEHDKQVVDSFCTMISNKIPILQEA